MDSRSVAGKAVVVGAGVMGAQIAAHLANAGWQATLLDIAAPGANDPKARNSVRRRDWSGHRRRGPRRFLCPSLPVA